MTDRKLVLEPFQRQALATLRDQNRRRRAYAILLRENPDWRAVKRANRLLRDASRAERVARNERTEVLWRNAAASVEAFAKSLGGAVLAIQDAAKGIEQMRIPTLMPGVPINMVAVKGAARLGKTAALEAQRDQDVSYVETRIFAIRDIPYSIGDIDALLDDPATERLRKLADDRARRFRERMEADVLAGRVHFPPPRLGCKHGIWLYGDSCATCARERADD